MSAVHHEDPLGEEIGASTRDLEAEAELLRRARRFVGQGSLPRAGGLPSRQPKAQVIDVIDDTERIEETETMERLGTIAGVEDELEAYRHPAAPWDPLESTCRHASLSIL